MLFTSPIFLFLFLPLTLLTFLQFESRVSRPAAFGLLVGASWFFYAWWEPAYLVLLIGSIAFNFHLGRIIQDCRLDGRMTAMKIALWVGVCGNLATLGYFKYAGFFLENIDTLFGAEWTIESILLPLGISFFTFQQITFLVDTSRGEAIPASPLHYALFVSFFPQLIAGPIVHHRDMLPQFLEPRERAAIPTDVLIGLSIFTVGLVKKAVLADGVAGYADRVFGIAALGGDVDFLFAWAGALAYTVQLYFDFSGYSDMAIGLALMFGIRLPINFASPYKSINIIEFWRRWHITLSRFLRDYLYIPLGGSRRGAPRTYANLAIVMLLGGLWHGAGWTFVIWGGVHGLYLLVNHAWRGFRPRIGLPVNDRSPVGRTVGWGITFVAVVVAWVYFRAPDLASANAVVSGMIGLNGFMLPIEWLSRFPELSASLAVIGIQFGETFGVGPMFKPIGDLLALFGYDAAPMVGSVTALALLMLPLAIAFFMPNTQQIFGIRSPRDGEAPVFDAPARLNTIWHWRPTTQWSAALSFLGAYAVFGTGLSNNFLYFNF